MWSETLGAWTEALLCYLSSHTLGFWIRTREWIRSSEKLSSSLIVCRDCRYSTLPFWQKLRKIRSVCRECQYMILALHNNQHQKSLRFLKVPCSSVASVASLGTESTGNPTVATLATKFWGLFKKWIMSGLWCLSSCLRIGVKASGGDFTWIPLLRSRMSLIPRSLYFLIRDLMPIRCSSS